MKVYYFDSSAIIKRYVKEKGSQWVKSIVESESAQMIILSQVTPVEVGAAFSRKVREGVITPFERDRVLGVFLKDCQIEYKICAINDKIIKRAINLTCNYLLRGYDAIQLAVASFFNNSLINQQLYPLIFVSADESLVEIAKKETLVVENPNLYT
ncbi:type II toxin-antitoxin system VapC family toxin [bacterium]|nr:type II toxin-antitoxin system VapC family toxin [bacterium]MBU0900164.1 type II toxin-antitoxin system VapC family toxin [bacterium]MBU1153047.1 type II toxin-antitoxin system VapC family toxin [bacterium]